MRLIGCLGAACPGFAAAVAVAPAVVSALAARAGHGQEIDEIELTAAGIHTVLPRGSHVGNG